MIQEPNAVADILLPDKGSIDQQIDQPAQRFYYTLLLSASTFRKRFYLYGCGNSK